MLLGIELSLFQRQFTLCSCLYLLDIAEFLRLLLQFHMREEGNSLRLWNLEVFAMSDANLPLRKSRNGAVEGQETRLMGIAPNSATHLCLRIG
jgi:hypothetical protein